MDNLLYSKYTSHRRPEFRMVTEIREKDGEKYVVKRPAGPSAEKHFHQLAENYQLLEDYYQHVSVLPIREEKDRAVFPFVAGRSLKERLFNEYDGRDSLVRIVNEFFGTVLDVKKKYQQPFAATKAFEQVFGKTELSGVPAVCPANIDAEFGNFIECDGQVICIDYEWVFNFPVPENFIRYRALHYLYYEFRQSVFSEVTEEELLGWFEIDDPTRKEYEKMEYSFQQYVHGENIRYQYLHRYLKSTVQPQEQIETYAEQVRERDEHIRDYQVIVEDREACIRRQNETLQEKEQAIIEKDGHIRNYQIIVEDRENTIHKQEATIQEDNATIFKLRKDVYDKDVHIRNMEAIARDRLETIRVLEAQYAEISNAFFWRITKPARVCVIKIRTLLQKNEKVYLAFRVLKRAISKGPGEAKLLWKLEHDRINGVITFDKIFPIEERKRQQAERFDRKIKFSILVPLYNTPETFLNAMIHSVIGQTYRNWELCLADGSDSKHSYVGRICRKLAKKEPRIRYIQLKENLGISDNTNACLEMATGDYIALFDHDDLLHPGALYEYMKEICEKDADFLYSDEASFAETPDEAYNFHHKPDFAPDTLRSYNYICHFTVFSRKLLNPAEKMLNKEYDGSQDYDLIMRLTERAKHIVHVPKILYYWRAHKESTSADVGNKPYIIDASHRALAAHLERVGLKGTVTDSRIPSSYKINYEIEGNPLVSIVIANKDHVDDLSKCLDSIREKSTWKNWEAIIVENNSEDQETFRYYEEAEKDPRIRVVRWEREFNYSAINNFGAGFAKGELILLLNNDIEVITPDWLEQMIMFAQRKDVGAVGAMLYYPDDTIQHAGVIVGLGGIAGHSHKGIVRGHPGYAIRLTIAQNLSAVTAACVMISRKAWEDVQGLDEGYAVAFNDVDLCLRIREAGYLIVWTPYAELYHYESKSRGYEDTPEKERRFESEKDRFRSKWGDKILATGDPYYNPNLTLAREDFSLKDAQG